ncbi:Arm DNA-binding domain-containing protein [Novosphingobium chloroacetimidivorans]|uniref:Arm DNA-binding domain-containing protein n=1 Tax=Novosphingobium chloroacetimidivorans TaxID=1428314 RepID=UPI0016159B67|nr:Arm DNA-binding domain-containing protein [Novosphingobium chloroacetimidivorans]
MPRKLRNALSADYVQDAVPGRYVDGDGLHLLVRRSGSRSWVFRFMVQGKSRDIGLGPAGPGGIALEEARQRRDQYRASSQKLQS